jgi:gliding motility-associated-like protein
MLLVLLHINTSAQNCPPNIDFESASFNGWLCHTGNVQAIGSTNVISLAPASPSSGRHTMLASFPGNGLDPYGGFPVNCPNGSGNSIKLGNDIGGAEAEGVSYEFTIPANRNEYNLIYNYAVVFQDPNHQQHEQPRMEIEIMNLTDNERISCSSFAFFPFGTPLPGFKLSPNPGSSTPVYYKEWSAVSINLDGKAGKRIRLFFKTSDCTFRRHFGYAYIDVNSECSGRFEGASFCPDDTAVNVIAPYGYQNYAWYNSDFSQLLGGQQVLSFMPPPAFTTQVAVVLTPYNGYGCLDTLYTTIKNDLVVIADAGKDTVSCNKSPVPIGGQPMLGVKYSWSPVAGLSNPDIANPVAVPDTTTTYVLTARSKGGGCVTTDTVVVKASLVDNTIRLLGKASYCIGSGDSAVLVVEQADSIQWYKNGVAIAGATQPVYKPMQSGLYDAELFGGNGCKLRTIQQPIEVVSIPVPRFVVNNPQQCLFGNSFAFTNTSTNEVGPINSRWVMGDGTELTTKDVIHTYAKAGVYKVTLITSSSNICFDSTFMTITVFQNAIGVFNVQPTCVNLPVTFTNKTADTLGSPISYLWTFGNGQTSALRNPPALVYNTTGNYRITLTVSTPQCPSPQHVSTKTLVIENPKPAIAYPLQYAVINLPLDLQARSFGGTVLWNPTVNLDNAKSYTPIFKGNKEQLYTIEVTAASGCVTVDTQVVKIVKSIEIYVPNAFTPDGDGRNDVLRPVTFGIKQLRYFRIYNRFGQLLYQSQQTATGWDGMYKGVRQEMQTVVWVVEALGVDGNVQIKKGTTVLIR